MSRITITDSEGAAVADEVLGLNTITIDCDPQLAEIIGLTN